MRAARYAMGLLLAAAVAGTAAVAAQEPPFAVPRLAGTIELDGRVDEPAWLAVPPILPVSSSPVYGVAPSERTEFRLAHDGTYLYVAGRLYDAEPDAIRATSLRRNEASMTNDWFALVLDTFSDRQTTLVFAVTPAGVRTDGIFANDADGGGNFSWNTFWDARTAVHDEGWSAEIRIPLSSLRFDVQGGRVVMGATIWRYIARKAEMISWPGIEHRWGLLSVAKASQTRPIALDGVQRLNPAYVTPYALSGPSMRHRPDATGRAFEPVHDWSREIGLDVKYSPAPGLAVDLTLNTDFAQVEADDQQVNLTRFSLFFPERRLFFQERAELFDFGLGGSDRLFYTRRMGLADGQPVRIYGGARATGRVGAWDIGLIDLQTAGTSTARTENNGVLRLRRRVLNDGSYAGGMLTSRLEAGGARSLAGGADALLVLGARNHVSAGIAATAAAGDSLGAAERGFVRARWERRGLYGLVLDAEWARVGAGFEPTLGFLARRGHTRGAGSVAWGWRMPVGSRFLRQLAGAGFSGHRRQDDGALESGELTARWAVESLRGHTITVTGRLRHEDLTRAFSIAPEVSVPDGTYRFATAHVAYAPSQAGLFRFNASVEAGGFFDGRLASASVSPTWNASRHLQLSGAWQLNRIDFADRGQQLTAHVARLRALGMLNSTISGIALLQYNSAADVGIVNLRLRYNPREGNDLYIVYNHGLNGDRLAYDPVRPLTDSRTLLVKYSHTLRFER